MKVSDLAALIVAWGLILLTVEMLSDLAVLSYAGLSAYYGVPIE